MRSLCVKVLALISWSSRDVFMRGAKGNGRLSSLDRSKSIDRHSLDQIRRNLSKKDAE